MNLKEQKRANKALLLELPFFELWPAQFNNLFSNVNSLPTKRDLERLSSIYDLDLFSLNLLHDNRSNYNDPTNMHAPRCKYYSPHGFSLLKAKFTKSHNNISILHNNIRSLKRNLESFQTHLLEELGHHFDIIGVTETRINQHKIVDFNPTIPKYNFEFVPTPLAAGGVGMYINSLMNYKILEKSSTNSFQALWIEILMSKGANIICGVIYRQHNSPDDFLNYFEETIEKLNASGKPIYLMGDFNINLLRSETCNYAQNFLLSLQSFNLMPTIDKPTRVHNNSATLIDNIFVNQLGNNVTSGNIVSDISDHYSQFFITHLKTRFKSTSSNKQLVRDYSKFSETTFLNDLYCSRLDHVVESNQNDINKTFSNFYNKLNKTINHHAPLKRISKRSEKQLKKPWITNGIRKAIKIKNQLLYQGNTSRYKFYRNKIQTLTRVSKRQYYQRYFENNFSSIKKTWEGINELINRKKKSSKAITCLQCPLSNRMTYNEREFPNIFNKYFTTVGNNLASKMPNSQIPFTHYLPNNHNSSSFVFTPILHHEIEEEIMSVPMKKAHGLYSCPIRILKCARHILSEPLAELMNKSVVGGKYPAKLKHSKVIPIYKKDEESDPTNYRPISLLSIFNKIFEKLMYKRLKSFLEKRNILFNSQYGFRENHSTQHSILDIINEIQSNMANKLYTCGIFIDLQKAFDTVNYSILLKKLQHYGIRGVVNDWFSSYLSGRMQTTQIGQNISAKEETLCGVPQGSILGPLLFLIYINDIYNSSEKLKFYLFADDTNLIYADKNLKSLEIVVNTELSKIHNWLIANKLSLNIDKSNYIIFHPYQKRPDYVVDLKIYDIHSKMYVSLERKNNIKYLGILIDCNLSWKYHIGYIASKVSRLIGIIAKLRFFVPVNTLINIYKSLILPHLTYGIVLWGQAAKCHIDKILKLQKRAIRLIYSAHYRSHAIPLFQSASILPINLLYIKSILMYDISKTNVPPNISAMFTSLEKIHEYNTRSSSMKIFYVKCTGSDLQKRFFANTGARVWNVVPMELRENSKHNFREKMHDKLLQMLVMEDEYIDISVILKKFGKTKN